MLRVPILGPTGFRRIAKTTKRIHRKRTPLKWRKSFARKLNELFSLKWGIARTRPWTGRCNRTTDIYIWTSFFDHRHLNLFTSNVLKFWQISTAGSGWSATKFVIMNLSKVLQTCKRFFHKRPLVSNCVNYGTLAGKKSKCFEKCFSVKLSSRNSLLRHGGIASLFI